ncbi:MAG: hypothetical protein IEMM0001_1423 [bacterium]|nr:MAG: hypothetical protein IEMM0001_1423 [bacterium]
MDTKADDTPSEPIHDDENPVAFHDERLPELLFRYRARNWPETLSAEEVQRWEHFCRHRLRDADGGGSITRNDYYERIAVLRDERE